MVEKDGRWWYICIISLLHLIVALTPAQSTVKENITFWIRGGLAGLIPYSLLFHTDWFAAIKQSPRIIHSCSCNQTKTNPSVLILRMAKCMVFLRALESFAFKPRWYLPCFASNPFLDLSKIVPKRFSTQNGFLFKIRKSVSMQRFHE